jgi:hypothetical protein
MNHHGTNKKILNKRRNVSIEINKKQKQSDGNQTNIPIRETISSLILSPKQNDFTRPNSTISRSKTVTKILPSMNILNYFLINIIYFR